MIKDLQNYVNLREDITDALKHLHGKGSDQFWHMALYYFVGDTIKAQGVLDGDPRIPYDNVAHKEMTRDNRQERTDRFWLNNLDEIARIETVQVSHFRKLKYLLILIKLVARYACYRLKPGRLDARKELTRYCSTLPDHHSSALQHVPTCFVEDFTFFYQTKVNVSNPIDTRKMKNGFGIAFAARIDHGLETRLEQHGAFYGETDSKGTRIEANLPTYFHTWGWSYSNRQVPGESKQLRKFAELLESHSAQNAEILIALPTYFDGDYPERLQVLLRCLEEAFPEILDQIVVRPRPKAHIPRRVQQVQQVRELIGYEVRVDCDRAIEDAVSHAALVVCLSHPATLFLQCVHVHRPVLGLISDVNAYIPQYKPYVNSLLDMGVLHLSPSSLAAGIKIALADLNSWVEVLEMDARYKDYRYKYCR